MATTLKRFTISLLPSMIADLDLAKQECYYKDTQNDMLKDLIIRGLSTIKKEEK